MKQKNLYTFSSDFKDDTLLYSIKTGEIFIRDTQIVNVKVPTYAKFYPKDTFAFTTTGVSGLQLFDAITGECVYKYKDEDLKMHEYSEDYVVATFDDYNLKFYDLRQRYMVTNKTFNNIKHIKWYYNNEILILIDGELIIYDNRNTGNCSVIARDVKSFTVSNASIYILTKDNYLMRIDYLKSESITKKTNLLTINSITLPPSSSNFGIYGMAEDTVKFEDNSNTWVLGLDFKITSIENLFFGKDKSYLLINKKIFEFDLNYDELKNFNLENSIK